MRTNKAIVTLRNIFFAFIGCLLAAQSQAQYAFTFRNAGTTGISGGSYSLTYSWAYTGDYNCGGGVCQQGYSGGPVGYSSTIAVGATTGGASTPGSIFQLDPITANTITVTLTGNAYLSDGTQSKTITASFASMSGSYQYIDLYNSPPQPCYSNLTWTVHNNENIGRSFEVIIDDGTYQGSPFYCPPQATRAINIQVLCTNAYRYSLVEQLPEQGRDVPTGIRANQTLANGTNSLPQLTTVTNPVYNAAPIPIPTYDTTNSYNQTNGILWSVQAGTNQNIAIQQGVNALYSAINNQAANANSFLAQLLTNSSANATNLAKDSTLLNVVKGINAVSNLLATTAGNTNSGSGSTGQTNTDRILMSISNLLATATNRATEITQIGISNLLSGLTNSFGTNNALTLQQWTNTMADRITMISNLQSEIFTHTNLASAISSSAILGSLPSGFSTTEDGPSSGGTASETISFVNKGGLTVSGDIGTAPVPTIFSSGRTVIEWFIYLSVFTTCWKMFNRAINDALQTPQAQTSGTSFAGTNLNIFSSISMGAVIVGLVATITAYALPKVTSYLLNITGNPISGFSGFGFDFITAYVPLGLMFSAIGVVITFRMGIQTIAMFVAGSIKMLVGV